MDRLSNIKVISIDFFRTLINIPPGSYIIWETYLKGRFPDEQSLRYLERAEDILSLKWNAAGMDFHHFKSVRKVLEETVSDLFNEIGFHYDPLDVTNFLMDQHKRRRLYEDVRPFLENVGRKYPICLASDGDLEMLENLSEIFDFDHVFTSETLRTYKLNPRFFSHVANHYQVEPANILHIGDSESDIVGPKQYGVMTCWLNRKQKPWKHPVRPDFEISSLLDALNILS